MDTEAQDAVPSGEPKHAGAGGRVTRPSARRPKPQLSCTLCRAKKLRCDRKHPCGNCRNRPLGTCAYVQSSGLVPPGRASGQPPNIQDRIRRLEQLVVTLAEAEGGESNGLRDGNDNTEDVLDPSPKLDVEESSLRVVGPSHWEAILGDIEGIKEELEHSRTPASGTEAVDKGNLPDLLLGHRCKVSFEELLCALPAKSVTDQLVMLFAEEVYTIPLMIHVPSFLDDYEKFWLAPKAVDLIWLSVFFSVLSLTLQLATNSGIPVNGLVLPDVACRNYHSRAVQCLVLSDYLRPTDTTIQALCLYMTSEHYWIDGEPFRGSIVLSMTVHLAMRAGFHRDPAHFPQMSMFKSEMRRRLWAIITQLDLLLTGKCGIPRLIDERKVDTKPPLNLTDNDLHPNMVEYPNERPSTEYTLVSLLNYKSRLLGVLDRINDHVNSSTPPVYDDILRLNKELSAKILTRPPWLCLDSDNLSVSTFNHIIDADLTEKRARMVLHRKYLLPGRSNKAYNSSRKICLQAAMEALQCQSRLYDFSCRHVKSFAANWRFVSLIAHDFLLAAMIICLDLDRELSSLNTDTEERLELLRTSYNIWMRVPRRDGELKAIEALRLMLNRVQSKHVAPRQSAFDVLGSGCDGSAPRTHHTDQASFEPNLSDPIQNLLSNDLELDWGEWDFVFST